MAEDQVDAAPVAVEKPAEKAKAAKKKVPAKPKKPAEHPKYAEMVKEALSTLKERGGSSRQAILKYIAQNYKLGAEEKSVNAHLKMALKAGVKNGTLKQSKGVGASGSFKLGTDSEGKEVKAGAKGTRSPAKDRADAAKKEAIKKPKAKSAPKSSKAKASPAKKSHAKKPVIKAKSPKKEVKKPAAKPKAKAVASPKAVKKAAKSAAKSKKASPAKAKK